jgi:hypothetical protein
LLKAGFSAICTIKVEKCINQGDGSYGWCGLITKRTVRNH